MARWRAGRGGRKHTLGLPRDKAPEAWDPGTSQGGTVTDMADEEAEASSSLAPIPSTTYRSCSAMMSGPDP